jgi:limonene-1,2-epoxide hydrolase
MPEDDGSGGKNRRDGQDSLDNEAVGMKRRGFMATAGFGVAAVSALSALSTALVGADRAEAAEWNDVEKANVKTVNDFCAAWSTRDISRALPFLADDCVYRMTETTAPANGHDGVIERLKPTVDSSTLVEFKVLDTAAAGPIVINHRIDRFMTARPFTWEGVGVFFVQGGKIKEWSDYTIRVQR